MGYTQLQTAGKPAVSYEEYGEMTAEAGIKIVGTHGDFKTMCNDYEQALDTKLMGVGGFQPKGGTDSNGQSIYTSLFNKVDGFCGSGVTVGVALSQLAASPTWPTSPSTLAPKEWAILTISQRSAILASESPAEPSNIMLVKPSFKASMQRSKVRPWS